MSIVPERQGDTPLGTAALELAEGGFRVFPITPRRKAPPLVRRGIYNATSDPYTVEWLWRRYKRANIAIRTGDGIAVVDIDPRNGGQPDLPGLPETLTSRTPSGGWHYYYRVTEPVRSSSSSLAPGVDVKADGGYVIAPPSICEHGSYEWEAIRPMAQIDASVLRVTDSRNRSTQRRRRHSSRGRRFRRSREFIPRENVREGARHDELVRWATWLRSEGYDEAKIHDVLLTVNDEFLPPVEDVGEVEAIAQWAGGLSS